MVKAILSRTKSLLAEEALKFPKTEPLLSGFQFEQTTVFRVDAEEYVLM